MHGSKEQAVPHPNDLRRYRDAAGLTRRQLSLLCNRQAEKDANFFTSVSIGAIRKLEAGLSRPRATTAATLAAALKKSVKTLFPNGLDSESR